MLIWSILFVSSLVLVLAIFAPFTFENTQFIYDFFSIVCHQEPSRSFYLKGVQLPVCARCLGIFLGYFFAVFSYPLVFERPKKIPDIKIILALTLPMVIDGIMQVFYTTPAFLRTLTGVMFSFGVVFLMIPVLNKAFRKIFKG